MFRINDNVSWTIHSMFDLVVVPERSCYLVLKLNWKTIDELASRLYPGHILVLDLVLSASIASKLHVCLRSVLLFVRVCVDILSCVDWTLKHSTVLCLQFCYFKTLLQSVHRTPVPFISSDVKWSSYGCWKALWFPGRSVSSSRVVVNSVVKVRYLSRDCCCCRYHHVPEDETWVISSERFPN